MRIYSWHTVVHPDWHEGEPPLYLVVNADGTPEEDDGIHTNSIEYKPNRKGGHRHNYLKNLEKRKRK